MARNYSAMQEGKRRAVIRQDIIKRWYELIYQKNVRKSLKNYDDLRGGGDQKYGSVKNI